MAAYRLGFGVMALWYALATRPYVSLIWHLEGDGSSFVYVGYWAWVISIILLVAGRWGVATRLLHLCLATWFLDMNPAPRSVQEYIYLYSAFWLLFIPIERVPLRVLFAKNESPKTYAPVPAWGFWMLGLQFGLYLFSAGLAKVLDPLWLHGQGFYYVLSLPWIKPASLNFLLDQGWLLGILNYVALAFELLYLPMYLFRRTRKIAIVGLIPFFFLLIFPLRLDFIGELGLALTIGVAAGTWIAPSPAQRPEFSRLRKMRRWSMGICLALMTYLFAFVLLKYPWQYPLTSSHLGVVDSSSSTTPVHSPRQESKRNRASRNLLLRVPLFLHYKIIHPINMLTFRIRFASLFSASHILGICEYRVIVQLSDGKQVEPVRPFRGDMTAGPDSFGPVPRWVQARMYAVTYLYHRVSRSEEWLPGDEVPRARITEDVYGIVRFAMQSVDSGKPESAVLWVRPIRLPRQPEGDVRLWEEGAQPTRWRPLFRFHTSGKIILEEVPPPFDVDVAIPGMDAEYGISF